MSVFIFFSTELVEHRIAHIIVGTQRFIVHDGWEFNGTRFLRVFTSFMRIVRAPRNGLVSQKDELAFIPLSVSPLAKEGAGNSGRGEE